MRVAHARPNNPNYIGHVLTARFVSGDVTNGVCVFMYVLSLSTKSWCVCDHFSTARSQEFFVSFSSRKYYDRSLRQLVFCLVRLHLELNKTTLGL